MGRAIRPRRTCASAASASDLSAATSGCDDRPPGGHHDRARGSTSRDDHNSWNHEHNGCTSCHHPDHGGATSGFYHDHRSGWRDRR